MLAMVAFFHDGPNTNTANTSKSLCIANTVQPARIAGESHQLPIAKFPIQLQIAESTIQLQIAEFQNQSQNAPNTLAIPVNYNQESADCEKFRQNTQKINNADMTSRNPAYDKNKLVVIIGLVLLSLMAMLVCSHIFSVLVNVIELKVMQTLHELSRNTYICTHILHLYTPHPPPAHLHPPPSTLSHCAEYKYPVQV